MRRFAPMLVAALGHALVAYIGSRFGGNDVVASHWNARGEADAHASRLALLLTFAPVSLLVGGIMAVAERAEPRLRADALTLRRYHQIEAGFQAFFVALHALVAFEMPVGRVVPVAMGVLFTLLGVAMRDVAPNGVMGLRLPWTLASDLAWRRAHRLNAWTMGIGGALTAVAGLWGAEAGLAVLMTTLFGSLIALTVLSWRWYAADPDRRPLGSRPGSSGTS